VLAAKTPKTPVPANLRPSRFPRNPSRAGMAVICERRNRQQPAQLSARKTSRAFPPGQYPKTPRIGGIADRRIRRRQTLLVGCQERLATDRIFLTTPFFSLHFRKLPLVVQFCSAGHRKSKDGSMLVLSRKKDESVVINNDIRVVVVEIRGDKVRLGVEAPKEVPVHRSEIYDAISRDEAGPTQDFASIDAGPAAQMADECEILGDGSVVSGDSERRTGTESGGN